MVCYQRPAMHAPRRDAVERVGLEHGPVGLGMLLRYVREAASYPATYASRIDLVASEGIRSAATRPVV
jgi:hypothetical protein